MTSCERAQSLYGPAWDDELSVTEREGLELHFTACPSCRRDYDEFARTLELVQGLPRPQVAGDFATRVLAEARRREAEARSRIEAETGRRSAMLEEEVARMKAEFEEKRAELEAGVDADRALLQERWREQAALIAELSKTRERKPEA